MTRAHCTIVGRDRGPTEACGMLWLLCIRGPLGNVDASYAWGVQIEMANTEAAKTKEKRSVKYEP